MISVLSFHFDSPLPRILVRDEDSNERLMIFPSPGSHRIFKLRDRNAIETILDHDLHSMEGMKNWDGNIFLLEMVDILLWNEIISIDHLDHHDSTIEDDQAEANHFVQRKRKGKTRL